MASPGRQLLLPVAIRLDLVDEDRALFTAVTAPIALSVALDVEPIDAPRSLDRIFPDARVHGPAAPLDVARKTDIDGKQSSHREAIASEGMTRRRLDDGIAPT